MEPYIRRRGGRDDPSKVLLHFDSTDELAHSGQQDTLYYGSFYQHQYHPLVIFNSETGQLVAAMLHPDNTSVGSETVLVSKRVVRWLRKNGQTSMSSRDLGTQFLHVQGVFMKMSSSWAHYFSKPTSGER